MAAGLGFKTFTTGEVLTAADTNGYLMQGVLVFASSAARAAAITSPQEGQYSYLKDTNSTEYYDGAAWIAAPIGDITGVTAGTGISGGGTSGTVTITNDMATTITAAGDIVVGTGSGTYDNLPIGTTAQVLTADTTVSPYKVKWATPSTTFVGCSLQKATQSLATGTWTALSWNVETNDSNGFHDNTTNNSRVTIPTGYAGRYLITTTLTYDQSSGVGARYIGVYKNGSNVSLTSTGIAGGGVVITGTFSMTYTDIVNCSVADYLEIYGHQSSGGALSVIGNASGVGISNFNVTYLGA